MATKIRWTDAERELLRKECLRMFTTSSELTTLELVRRAQRTALPSERRRDLTGVQQVSWIQNLRDEFLKRPSEEPAVREVHIPELPKPDPMAMLKSMLSDMLFEALTDVIADVRMRVDQALDTRLPRLDLPPVDSYKHKKKLKRVFVYGLRKDVSDQVEKKLSGCYDFRCMDHAHVDKIRSAVEWADGGHIYLMTNFIGHSEQDVIKDTARRLGKTTNYVTGTVTALVHALEDKYLEEK